MLSPQKFAELVVKMRLAQTRYFELMAMARKSKHPEAFTAARNILTVSKSLEQQVDMEADKIMKTADVVQ